VGCWSSPQQKGRAATADSGSVVLGQPSSQNSRSPTVATVPDRPLRPRRRRFGTLLQQLECGVWERTPVRCLQVALFGRLPRRAGAACTWLHLIRPAVRPSRGPTYRYECASAPPRTTNRHHTRYNRAHPRQIVQAQRAVRLRASSAGRLPNTGRGIRVSTAANVERSRGTAYPIRPPKTSGRIHAFAWQRRWRLLFRHCRALSAHQLPRLSASADIDDTTRVEDPCLVSRFVCERPHAVVFVLTLSVRYCVPRDGRLRLAGGRAAAASRRDCSSHALARCELTRRVKGTVAAAAERRAVAANGTHASGRCRQSPCQPPEDLWPKKYA